MGVRARLLLVVLGTVAVGLIVMTVAFNYLLLVSFNSDADKRLRTLALDESSRISISDGRVTLPRPTGEIQELGTQIWVFVSGATVSAPSVEPTLQAAAKSLDGQPPSTSMCRSWRYVCTAFPLLRRRAHRHHCLGAVDGLL